MIRLEGVLDRLYVPFKSGDSNFEVNIFQMLKVATNKTATLH